jgi:hypothetical protein
MVMRRVNHDRKLVRGYSLHVCHCDAGWRDCAPGTQRDCVPPHNRGYIAAMLLLNASALAVYRLTGHFEPFHALALVAQRRFCGASCRRYAGAKTGGPLYGVVLRCSPGCSLQRGRAAAIDRRRRIYASLAGYRGWPCDRRRVRDDHVAATQANRHAAVISLFAPPRQLVTSSSAIASQSMKSLVMHGRTIIV